VPEEAEMQANPEQAAREEEEEVIESGEPEPVAEPEV
jgi:hypothetical protein